MRDDLKIVVGVNTLTSIDTEVYGSHSNFWYYQGKMHPTWKFWKFHPRRLSIDHMRNVAAELALLNQCDYLMFIDDDVIIEKDVLDSLLQADKDVVAALTYVRGYPFNPMVFKMVDKNGLSVLEFFEDEDFITEKTIDGIVPCEAVGFSCVLIKCELLKKLSTPYFVTGSRNTEDIYFCMKAKSEVTDVSIAVDIRKPTMHLMDKLPVADSTVHALRHYFEELGERKDREVRPVEYIDNCLKSAELVNVEA